MNSASHNPEHPDVMHPMLGDLFSKDPELGENLNLDSFERLYDLERRYFAACHIRSWLMQPGLSELDQALAPLYAPMHTVDDVNNQFEDRIVECVLTEEKEEAHEKFRKLYANTIDEELVLLINDTQFSDLHTSLHEALMTSEEQISTAVEVNQRSIEEADRHQFNGKATRSLERIRQTGFEMAIDPSKLDQIRQARSLAADGVIPITEHIKNERILNVNGFVGSKISLAVHDNMDHIWLFDMLDRSGLLDRYSELFMSVGNPESTDIFKREGEMVASIAFGVRYYHSMPSGFTPNVRTPYIEKHMDKLFVEGLLEPKHMNAYRTIKQYREGSMEWQSLGFVFSNYLTELEEQRRKHGSIKQRNNRNQIIGELDPFSPDYICLFIDTHHELFNPSNKHRDDLLRFHILLEEYLTSIANGTIPSDEVLTLKIGQLRSIDFSKTTLPPQRIKWIFRNPGFTAVKGTII